MHNNQKYTPVRFSHLMSYAGVGAIVRGSEDKLMTVTDTSYWTDKYGNITADDILYVARVSKALDLDKKLKMPPKGKEGGNGEIEGDYLPAVLFPKFTICQECKTLHYDPWESQRKKFTDYVYCEKCKNKNKLEQVTWCAVSNKGHLDEVPWHYICHARSDTNCKEDIESNYLKFDSDKNGKSIIVCTKCGSRGYYENARLGFLKRIQPWIYNKNPQLDENDIVEILEVNSPGVYLPERVNALVIPPESRMSKNSITDKLYNNSKLLREISSIKIPGRKVGKLQEVATRYRCTVDEVKIALEKIDQMSTFTDNITVGELREDEYEAFKAEMENVADDEDFVTVHKTKEFKDLYSDDLPNDLQAIVMMIDNHIIATRLREIQVFKGFYRGFEGTTVKNEQAIEVKRELVKPDIVDECDWLPAIELFGEGIFFSIDEEILLKWEKIEAVQARAAVIMDKYEKIDNSLYGEVEITPRFLLLHTLSHLLIRELESTSGYPAASLKERIYSSIGQNMSGVLIYTTVVDIVGSLGGIVESAEPKEFLALMEGVFKHAQWCSLDPVCTEHEGQGPGWLNRAACHACALIPEPSCDHGNVFLDRVFVKGNKKLRIPNFLEFVINNKRNF